MFVATKRVFWWRLQHVCSRDNGDKTRCFLTPAMCVATKTGILCQTMMPDHNQVFFVPKPSQSIEKWIIEPKQMWSYNWKNAQLEVICGFAGWHLFCRLGCVLLRLVSQKWLFWIEKSLKLLNKCLKYHGITLDCPAGAFCYIELEMSREYKMLTCAVGWDRFVFKYGWFKWGTRCTVDTVCCLCWHFQSVRVWERE